MIAVTGANGLLGSFILRKLANEKIPVIGLHKKDSDLSHLQELTNISWRELEILDPISVEEGIKDATHVIHTAASVSFNPRLQKNIMAVNVEGTRHIVNACLAQNVQQLIHISSVAALGRKKETPTIDEASRWVENDLNTDYAKSKYLGEVEVWRGAEEGLPVTVINPSVILAPSNWGKSSAQLFHYVWKEKKIYARGLVNYVDARDVAEMAWQIYSQKITGERFIANGGNIEIKGLFDLMAIRFKKKAPSIEIHPRWVTAFARLEELRAQLMGREPLITRQTAKITKENFRYLSTKATGQLGISFRTLEETLDWCCNYYLQAYTTNK